MKNLLTLLFCLFIAFNIFGQASISGQVTDKQTGEPILFGDVIVYRNGALVTGVQTDFDGNYSILLYNADVYEVVFKYVGYTDLKIKKVETKDNGTIVLNASIKSSGTTCGPICISYKVPLMGFDMFESGQIFTSYDIKNLPNKN